MQHSRRGFFRLALALPVAPKCIQRFRMGTTTPPAASQDAPITGTAMVYREGKHIFYLLEVPRG